MPGVGGSGWSSPCAMGVAAGGVRGAVVVQPASAALHRIRARSERGRLGASELITGRGAEGQSPQLSPIFSAWMNASCGISTLPNCRMRFLPSFCFSRSLRLRETSPP